MTTDTCELSVIIPVYNDRRVLNSIKCITAVLDNENISYELIVSGIYCNPRELHNVLYIKTNKKGKGYAIKNGVHYSKGKKIIICDADFPVEKNVFVSMIHEAEHVEAVFGERIKFIGFSRDRYPIERRILGYIFRKLVGFIFSTKEVDTQCGLKCLYGNTARRIYSKTQVNGFLTDIEVTILCRQNGINIKNFPLTWCYVPKTTVSLIRNIPDTLFDFIKLTKIVINRKCI
ncbi:MAG: glycosyltransferase [Candidatus Electrothrix sp. AX5]|nr:glycosyltransferase [Candidatus Electrothrix sp. AX5]